MPPRFAYWTILAGGLPTAFRATDREELLPTFNRIREKHPDAEMKWFARGKLWNSPEEAQAQLRPPRSDVREPGDHRRPFRPREESRERRGRDWRPGGEHRDPRQEFKDAKKARNQEHRQQRWDRKNAEGHRPQATGPRAGQGEKPAFQGAKPWQRDRPTPQGAKPWQRDRPQATGHRPKPNGGSTERPKFQGANPRRPRTDHRPPRRKP